MAEFTPIKRQPPAAITPTSTPRRMEGPFGGLVPRGSFVSLDPISLVIGLGVGLATQAPAMWRWGKAKWQAHQLTSRAQNLLPTSESAHAAALEQSATRLTQSITHADAHHHLHEYSEAWWPLKTSIPHPSLIIAEAAHCNLTVVNYLRGTLSNGVAHTTALLEQIAAIKIIIAPIVKKKGHGSLGLAKKQISAWNGLSSNYGRRHMLPKSDLHCGNVLDPLSSLNNHIPRIAAMAAWGVGDMTQAQAILQLAVTADTPGLCNIQTLLARIAPVWCDTTLTPEAAPVALPTDILDAAAGVALGIATPLAPMTPRELRFVHQAGHISPVAASSDHAPVITPPAVPVLLSELSRQHHAQPAVADAVAAVAGGSLFTAIEHLATAITTLETALNNKTQHVAVTDQHWNHMVRPDLKLLHTVLRYKATLEQFLWQFEAASTTGKRLLAAQAQYAADPLVQSWHADDERLATEATILASGATATPEQQAVARAAAQRLLGDMNTSLQDGAWRQAQATSFFAAAHAVASGDVTLQQQVRGLWTDIHLVRTRGSRSDGGAHGSAVPSLAVPVAAPPCADDAPDRAREFS